MAEQLGITGKTSTGRFNLNYTGQKLAELLEKLDEIEDLELEDKNGVITFTLRGQKFEVYSKDQIKDLVNQVEKLRTTVRYEEVKD